MMTAIAYASGLLRALLVAFAPQLKLAVNVGVGAGLTVAVAASLRELGRAGWSAMDIALMAWIAGSAIASQIGLSEMLETN